MYSQTKIKKNIMNLFSCLNETSLKAHSQTKLLSVLRFDINSLSGFYLYSFGLN